MPPDQSVSLAIPGSTPQGTPPPAPTTPSDFKLPEAYASKGWAQNIKSSDQLFSEMDNLQGLLGKPRISLPEATATPEQKAEWKTKVMREHFGAPADAKEYEPNYAGAEEFKAYQRPAEADATIKGLLAKHAVPKEFGAELLATYDKVVVANGKKRADIAAQLAKEDEMFKGVVTKTFGLEADVRVKQALEGLARVLPNDAAPMIAALDPNGRAMLAVVADHFAKRYTGEGLLGQSGQQSAGTGGSIEVLRSELYTLVNDPAIINRSHPDNAAKRAKQADLEKRIWDLKNSAK